MLDLYFGLASVFEGIFVSRFFLQTKELRENDDTAPGATQQPRSQITARANEHKLESGTRQNAKRSFNNLHQNNPVPRHA